ncbi:MAG TPA: prephenate dehydrogenase/arogenate dehydrogenase family protein, partial [Porphyromonadaceae bacterium]|nr:prephenate dehydrogenase/arogenate dehydrogenase family protein [Porphyromonadaceae bacterium]
FADVLSFDHEVAVLDTDPMKLRFIYNTQRMADAVEVKAFAPELVINAATLKYT